MACNYDTLRESRRNPGAWPVRGGARLAYAMAGSRKRSARRAAPPDEASLDAPLWSGGPAVVEPRPETSEPRPTDWERGLPESEPRPPARRVSTRTRGRAWAAVALLVLLVAVWEDGFEERLGKFGPPAGAVPAPLPTGVPRPPPRSPAPPGPKFSESVLDRLVLAENEAIAPSFYLKQASGRKKLADLAELDQSSRRRFRALGFRAASKSFFASTAFLQTQGYAPGQVSWMRSSAYLFGEAPGASGALDAHERLIRERYEGARALRPRRLGGESYGLARTDEVTVLVYAWRSGNLIQVLEIVGGRGALTPTRALSVARRLERRARAAA